MNCSLLITDLDNTLWDWFEIWRASFGAMLTEVARISSVPEDVLEREIRAVHQRQRTAEYAFVLEELPSLLAQHARNDIREIYKGAIQARRTARHRECKLYDGVRSTLESVRASGALIVGYTESMAFYTSDRLRRTGLDDLIDVLYSSPDHDLPGGVSPSELRRHPPEYYRYRRTVHRHTPSGSMKPNAEILLSIISDMRQTTQGSVYVGDSLMKDVAMAQQAGVTDVWARYGESHGKHEYEQLRRVTFWTAEDVERERALTAKDVRPTHIINRFRDLHSLFVFGTPSGGRDLAHVHN